MAATLDVATNDTHALAFTAHCTDTVLVGRRIQLADLDTGAELQGWATVAVSAVALDEVDRLEIVSPDRKSTSTRALAQEVVASVLDNQANIRVAREIDCQLNLSNGRDLHGVAWKATELARAVGGVLGHAGLALEEGRHDRSRVIGAVKISRGPETLSSSKTHCVGDSFQFARISLHFVAS